MSGRIDGKAPEKPREMGAMAGSHAHGGPAGPGGRPPGRRGHGHGPGGPMMPGEKAKDFKGTVRKLLSFLGAYKVRIIIVFIFAICATAFSVVGPKVLSLATTELFNGFTAKANGTGSIDFEAIARILAITLGIYVVSAGCNLVQGWIMAKVTQQVTFDLREAISKKINRVPFGYFEKTTVGDTLSRITNDVDTLGQSMSQGLTQLVTSTVTFFGVLAMMLSINVIMTLVVLCLIPLTALFIFAFVKISQKYFVAQQRTLGEINGIVEETFSGHAIVRAFNQEESTIASFNETNDRLFGAAWKAQFASSFMKPVMDFVGNLGYVAVAILGCFFAVQGVVTVGDIQAFIQYVKNFMQPLQQLAQISSVFQQMAAAAERIFEFLGCPEEDEDDAARRLAALEARASSGIAGTAPASEDACDAVTPSATHVLPSVSDGEPSEPCSVEFDHVRFGYAADEPIIHDFSARVAKGQTVALVGPTGAGKTTIVKLLMRFYDVQGGAIRIHGVDVRDMDRDEVRARFGMVLQDTWLFSGSIRENLRYGKLDASDEEVVAAAKAAGVHRFIMALPGGYDFEINEDASNLSQGQLQLLTIARAILANRDMLILDEATSSVDTSTEEHISKAMDRLMAGRTSFVIAHRLSTIRDADLILVMQHGDIAEQGTHDELLSLGGIYSELYNAQFEEIEDER